MCGRDAARGMYEISWRSATQERGGLWRQTRLPCQTLRSPSHRGGLSFPFAAMEIIAFTTEPVAGHRRPRLGAFVDDRHLLDFARAYQADPPPDHLAWI